MSNPTRVLLVVSEAVPFTPDSPLGALLRALSEKLQESGRYELRIMMPRYGVISERRNRLHEVIRLSGADLPVGDETESLKVKVASIPGLRLQVYFMENARYFKRKGTHVGRDGDTYDDNAARALFFGRAALTTIRNLGWSPDVVHAVGWAAALVPYLVSTEYAGDDLLGQARAVYTPDGADAAVPVDPALLAGPGADAPDLGADATLRSVAALHSSCLLYDPVPPVDDGGAYVAEAMACYDRLVTPDAG